MIYYTVASWIFFALLVAAFLYFVLYLAINFKDREKRIKCIQSFKKGKCLVVFLIAIPLFIMGYIYAGNNGWTATFSAIENATGLVVLKYKDLPQLVGDNLAFAIAYRTACILVVLNALMFTFSFICHFEWRRWDQYLLKHSKERVVLIGFNEKSLAIYSSIKDKKIKPIIIDNISKDEANNLFIKDVLYYSSSRKEALISYVKKLISSSKSNTKIIIVW